MTTKTEAARRAQLAAIHIIKKSLDMGDDVYRDVMYQHFGKRSSVGLTPFELNIWLLHLKSLQKRAGLNTTGVRHEAMIKKCEALWVELRKSGAVKNGSAEALQAFVQNTTGATALRMANGQQLFKTIEALKSWLARVEAVDAKTKGSDT